MKENIKLVQDDKNKKLHHSETTMLWELAIEKLGERYYDRRFMDTAQLFLIAHKINDCRTQEEDFTYEVLGDYLRKKPAVCVGCKHSQIFHTREREHACENCIGGSNHYYYEDLVCNDCATDRELCEICVEQSEYICVLDLPEFAEEDEA